LRFNEISGSSSERMK
ncbi:hypothetical protein Tco_0249085, partial [Tanacetum coccineum]